MEISDDKRTISRPTQEGYNPAALSKFPLNKFHNRIEFEVIALTGWLTLGVSAIGPAYEGGGKKISKISRICSIYFSEFFSEFYKDCLILVLCTLFMFLMDMEE